MAPFLGRSCPKPLSGVVAVMNRLAQIRCWSSKPGKRWVWSETVALEPLVSVEDFDAAQAIMANSGRARQASHETREVYTADRSAGPTCAA